MKNILPSGGGRLITSLEAGSLLISINEAVVSEGLDQVACVVTELVANAELGTKTGAFISILTKDEVRSDTGWSASSSHEAIVITNGSSSHKTHVKY